MGPVGLPLYQGGASACSARRAGGGSISSAGLCFLTVSTALDPGAVRGPAFSRCCCCCCYFCWSPPSPSPSPSRGLPRALAKAKECPGTRSQNSPLSKGPKDGQEGGRFAAAFPKWLVWPTLGWKFGEELFLKGNRCQNPPGPIIGRFAGLEVGPAGTSQGSVPRGVATAAAPAPSSVCGVESQVHRQPSDFRGSPLKCAAAAFARLLGREP